MQGQCRCALPSIERRYQTKADKKRLVGEPIALGRGTALLRHVEQVLAERGERVLLVETSGLPAFERTRAFYQRCGYDVEARIRDFYQAGEDKIIFRKALAPASPA